MPVGLGSLAFVLERLCEEEHAAKDHLLYIPLGRLALVC